MLRGWPDFVLPEDDRETRFVPGNPDTQAMAIITRTLGWKKAIFVLTYAAEVNYAASDGTAFQDGIEMWKKVIKHALSNEASVPQSHLNINVIPAVQLAIIDNPTYLTVNTGCPFFGQNATILFPVLLHVKPSTKPM